MSLQKPVIEGVFYTKVGERMFHYLRFYLDGFVMAVTVAVKTGNAIDTWEKVQKWFHREHTDLDPNHGQWSLVGKHIRFTVLSEEGAVDYEGSFFGGSFFGDRLVLDSYSHINGYSDTGIVYHRLMNS